MLNHPNPGSLEAREWKNLLEKAKRILDVLSNRTGQTYEIVPVNETKPVEEVKTNVRPSKRTSSRPE